MCSDGADEMSGTDKWPHAVQEARARGRQEALEQAKKARVERRICRDARFIRCSLKCRVLLDTSPDTCSDTCSAVHSLPGWANEVSSPRSMGDLPLPQGQRADSVDCLPLIVPNRLQEALLKLKQAEAERAKQVLPMPVPCVRSRMFRSGRLRRSEFLFPECISARLCRIRMTTEACPGDLLSFSTAPPPFPPPSPLMSISPAPPRCLSVQAELERAKREAEGLARKVVRRAACACTAAQEPPPQ